MMGMDTPVGSMGGQGAEIERDGDQWPQFLKEVRCIVIHKRQMRGGVKQGTWDSKNALA